MATGKKAGVKFKPGLCKMANMASIKNPDTITVDFDRHVLVKIKEAAEEKINKIEYYKTTLENRKEKLALDDEQNYELWKSIRDRLGECLVQGKLQKSK